MNIIDKNNDQREINQDSNTNGYIYNDNLMHYIKKTIDREFNMFSQENPEYSLKENEAKAIYSTVSDVVYFVYPNPTTNLKFLIVETGNINFFMKVTDETNINKLLRRHYKEVNREFRNYYPFERFINKLPVYKEELNGYNVLLQDGLIYDYETMMFKVEIDKLTTFTSDLTETELTETEYNILETYFRYMYPSEDTYKQFLLFIAVAFNKNLLKQAIFINIDKSKIGKSARIDPLLKLKFNTIATSGLLKSTELFNIANRNMVIFNEVSGQKNKINGSQLSLLADSQEYITTVKGKEAINIKSEHKPLLTIMGENMPLLEALNDGTARRFYLVPRVSESYKGRVTDIQKKKNLEKYDLKANKQFYDLLYNEAFKVLVFYLTEIHKYKIIENTEKISNSMRVTIDDLKDLITTKEDIFNKFFNLTPLEEPNVCNYPPIIYIGKGESLNKYLNLIDTDYITTEHFNTTKEARKYLNKILKDNNEVTNIKYYGRTRISKYGRQEESYRAYQITEYGRKIIDKYNTTATDKDKILYKIVDPATE